MRNIQRFQKGFSGMLVSDTFSGNWAPEKEEPDIHAAFCYAHAWRDYVDALKTLKGNAKELANETIAHKVLT